VPVVASQALLETLRLVAYGHLLPNSVIYKAGSGGMFDVVAKLAALGGPVLVAAAVGAYVTRDRRRLLAVAPLVYALGSLRMMDSADAFARFFIPVWPQIALLAGLALTAARHRMSRSGRAPALALAAATALLMTSGIAALPAIAGFGSSYAQCRQQARRGAADWIRAHTDSRDTLAISDAGLVPASADRTAIDQFMLNDPRLQRTGRLPVGRRVAYVYRARPDVLVLASHRPDRFAGIYATDRAMARATQFRRYRRAAVSRGHGGGCGYHLVIYVRR
jgi:arabinofuranosyltransferase